MFLCSRPLRRVRLPGVLSFSISTSRSQLRFGSHVASSSATGVLLQSRRPSSPALTTESRVGAASGHWRDLSFRELSDQELTALLCKHTGPEDFGSYMELRRRGMHCLSALRPAEFVLLARDAKRATAIEVMDYVVRDIIALNEASCSLREEHGENTGTDYTMALRNILHVACWNLWRGYDREILDLFRALLRATGDSGTLPDLTNDMFIRIVKAILAQPSEWEVEKASLLDAVLKYAESIPSNKFTEQDPLGPNLSWSLFLLIQYMLGRGHNQLTLSFLQVMVHKGVIPDHAMKISGRAPDDFRAITVSVLLRSCIHHNWLNCAMQLLRSEDLKNEALTEYYTKLINEILTTSLNQGTPSRLTWCGRLVGHVLSQNPAIRLTSACVSKFFQTAFAARAGNAAETFYEALRSPSVLENNVYDLPEDQTVVWLLEYITKISKNTHTGKLLAQHLVESPRQVNIYERARVIGLCAAGGYVDESRALWKRYVSGPDGVMVAGHARCMLCVVRLFYRASTGEVRKHQPGGQFRSTTGSTDSAFDSSPLVTCPTFDGTDDLVNKPPIADQPDENVLQLVSGRVGREENVAEWVADDMAGRDQYYEFACSVLNAFRRAKEPLHHASHYDLNALARASDMLGLVRQSMSALQVIMERKEVPDQWDLNIVVTAMAARDPTRAETMLKQMLQEQVDVSFRTFSAIINGAIANGDIGLASRVYARALRLGYEELSPTVATALLEACLGAADPPPATAADEGAAQEGCMAEKPLSSSESDMCNGEGRKTRRMYLRQAYALMSSPACARDVRTPELGGRCARAALREDEGALAFHFWKIMTKGRQGRGCGEEQMQLGREIAEAVREEYVRGQVSESEMGEIVAGLGGSCN